MSLKGTRDLIAAGIASIKPGPCVQLQADAHLTSAILQKTLRRADREFATRSALLLANVDPARLWRRLTAISFEDFGWATMDVTRQVVAAASDAAWRQRVGGDVNVASYLVERLLKCPRDRWVDELYMLGVVLSKHPDTDVAITNLKASPLLTQVLRKATEIILRCEQADGFRGMPSLLVKACDTELDRGLEQGWVGSDIHEICLQGRRTAKCLLPVLVPLVKWASDQTGAQSRVISRPVPQTQIVGGLPAYTIDGYSELGRMAIAELARREPGIRKVLSWVSTPKLRSTCLRELLFAVEGGVCTEERVDPLYEELRTYSRGCWSGLPREALPEAFAIMEQAIPLLNWIRGQLMSRRS